MQELKVHPYANLQLKMLFHIPQVGGFRKVIGRFGRDMINAGDPHQIAGLFDTFDHNIQLILNGRDRIPELTAEYRIQNTDCDNSRMYEIDKVESLNHKLELLFQIRTKFL